MNQSWTPLQPEIMSLGAPQTELVGRIHAASDWWSMCMRTDVSETYPTKEAKYDFDHDIRLSPSHKNSVHSVRLVHPLKR